MRPIRRLSPTLPLLAATLLLLAGCNRNADTAATPPAATAQEPAPMPNDTSATSQPPKADPQMQAVLDQLAKLGVKPIETLTPEQARAQPSPADAVRAVLQAQDKPTTPEAVARVQDSTFPGPAGAVPIRIYTPEVDGDGPLPVILYIHGGGWVIADLDTYDASPRALANAAKAVVVSTHYRQAPEDKFPAAHEDTLAAYKWVLAHAAEFGGDPKRVAVAGESAGGNMAADIAIAARDQHLQAPVAQVLIYPVAGNDTSTPSYIENANAKPLSKPAMLWFIEQTFALPEDAADPRINLVDRTDLAGLAPATVIVDQIDPLRSEGRAYAEALQKAGVPVKLQQYDGVTHEFFGMAAVVDKAKQAQQLVGEQLRKAFAGDSTNAATSTAADNTDDADAAMQDRSPSLQQTP